MAHALVRHETVTLFWDWKLCLDFGQGVPHVSKIVEPSTSHTISRRLKPNPEHKGSRIFETSGTTHPKMQRPIP
jgi:hypothetical protein